MFLTRHVIYCFWKYCVRIWNFSHLMHPRIAMQDLAPRAAISSVPIDLSVFFGVEYLLQLLVLVLIPW